MCTLILLCYVGFTSAISYRNYKVFFNSIYLQYKNEEYSDNIDKLNLSLKSNINELHREIRKRRAAERKNRKLASTDTLTGAENRLSLNVKIKKVFSYADRTKTNVGIVFLDFDKFKLINDTFGHHIGDELLKSVVRRLKECVRMTDEIFRVGGDEFIVLVTNINQQKSLIHVAQNMLQVLEQPHFIEGKSITSKASMGISIYPINGTNPENLLKFADEAMYLSKEGGGNSYIFHGQ